MQPVWQRCLERLEQEIPADQFNQWIRPLQAEEEGERMTLYAPNPFVLDWVNDHYRERMEQLLGELGMQSIGFSVGSRRLAAPVEKVPELPPMPRPAGTGAAVNLRRGNLNREFTFDNFVEGKSNSLAKAAAAQVAENPGEAYNPLAIYGGTGLGKTHLMQAIGNTILRKNPNASVAYLNSENFFQDMVKALQHKAIDEFKRFYRSLDALLIDDIQFFAGKDYTQEEFFHTFNALLDGQRQIIITCDRFPKEVEGLEDRLKSRFSWGLTVAIEPPDLETRVAILKSKAAQGGVALPSDVAFFMGERIRSHVRELEGALRRVIATARFTNSAITVDFAKQALSDLLAVQAKLVTIENIQKTVAAYYKIRVADLRSNRRSRSVARPRQIAMALAKELTSHSLPEIGDAFGRDHTTVLYACNKVKELREADQRLAEDYANLLRTLTT